MNQILLFSLLIACGNLSAMAYEQAFPKTSPGDIEIKTLPAATVITTDAEQGDYFETSDTLFMPLFRYIQDNEISMTTPVESSIKPGRMSFFMGSQVDIENLQEEGKIKVRSLPERTVLAVGIRGSYSKEHYEEALGKAQNWMNEQSKWKPDGPARMIYWNGPYVPWFLKTSELHLPVKPAE